MRWRSRSQVACPQCAAVAPADARWCGACGARLRAGRTGDEDDRDAPAAADEGRRGRLAAAGVLLLVLAGLLVGRATTEPPVVPAGHTARGDGARSGVVAATAIPAPTGVAWRSPVELPPLTTAGTDVLGATTAADGRELLVVIDPSPDGQRVTVHEAATGTLVATTMLPLGSQPYDVSLRDGLLAHRDLTSVTLLDLATGERQWRIEQRLRDDTELTPVGVVGVPAAAEEVELVSLGLEDGEPGWRTSLAKAGRVAQLTATTDTLVVIGDAGDSGPFLAALDLGDGAVRWRLTARTLPIETAGRPGSPFATAVVTDDAVVVGGLDGLAVIDLADGAIRVLGDDTAAAADTPLATIAVAGEVVVRSDGRFTMTGLELATGRHLWTTRVPESPVLTMAGRGGVIAVRGDSGTTLLAADTGERISRVGPPGDSARLTVTAEGGVAQLRPPGDLELVGTEGLLWRVPTTTVHLPDLVTDAGRVAVTTPDGVQVHTVDDGERQWSHEAFSADLVTAGSLTPAALLGGRVFLAPALTQPPDRGGLLSLFADTGIVDWARDDDRVVPRGTPVIDRDLVVLPVGSQLLGFDRVTGRRAMVVETTIARTDLAAADGWLVATDAPRDGGDLWVGRRADRALVFRAPIRTCAPPVIHDDLVLTTDHLGDIVARTLEDGEQPWGERARGSACRPLAIADEVLVALVDDAELLAVTLDDGDPAWRVALPAHAAGAPVVAGDQVLVPTIAGEVVAYEVRGTTAPDGPAWQVEVGGTPAGSVAVDGTTVLVLTREGELVGLR